MKAAAAPRIGDRLRIGRGDEHQIAFAHALEQLPHIVVRQAHAAMREGAADEMLLVGAVQINVARQRVAARPAIDAVLEPVEREDAGQDQIVVAGLAAPGLAGRLARHEHGAGRRALADPRMNAVPAGRRAERVLLPADAVARRRHRPGGDRFTAFEQSGDLALGVDHQQALGQGGRRAGAHQALARKSESAGGILVGGGGHARTLPYRERAPLPPN